MATMTGACRRRASDWPPTGGQARALVMRGWLGVRLAPGGAGGELERSRLVRRLAPGGHGWASRHCPVACVRRRYPIGWPVDIGRGCGLGLALAADSQGHGAELMSGRCGARGRHGERAGG